MFNYYSGHSGHESKLLKLFFFSFIVSWIENVLVSIGDLSRNVEFVQISQFSEAVWLSHISWDVLFDSPVSISGLVRDLACVPKSRGRMLYKFSFPTTTDQAFTKVWGNLLLGPLFLTWIVCKNCLVTFKPISFFCQLDRFVQ